MKSITIRLYSESGSVLSFDVDSCRQFDAVLDAITQEVHTDLDENVGHKPLIGTSIDHAWRRSETTKHTQNVFIEHLV